MNGLIHCIYASAATVEFAEHQIPLLLEQSRAANASRGITGMLLYMEGSFSSTLGSRGSVTISIVRRAPFS